MSEKLKRAFKGIWIPARLYLEKELSWTEKILLIEIDSLSTDKRGCFASNAHFAEFIGIKEMPVKNMLTSLKKRGYIEYSTAGGCRGDIRIIQEKSAQKCADSAQKCADSAQKCAENGKLLTLNAGNSEFPPNNTLNNTFNKYKEDPSFPENGNALHTAKDENNQKQNKSMEGKKEEHFFPLKVKIPPEKRSAAAPPLLQKTEIHETFNAIEQKLQTGKTAKRPLFRSEKRLKGLARVLKEFKSNGLSAVDLLAALDKMMANAWLMGENPGGVVYLTFDFFVRPGKAVEWFEREDGKQQSKQNDFVPPYLR